MRFVYAHIWNVPPHDPALDRINAMELEIYSLARLELMDIFSGRKKPGPSSSFLQEAQRRLKKAQGAPPKDTRDLVPVTSEELGWVDSEKER